MKNNIANQIGILQQDKKYMTNYFQKYKSSMFDGMVYIQLMYYTLQDYID